MSAVVAHYHIVEVQRGCSDLGNYVLRASAQLTAYKASLTASGTAWQQCICIIVSRLLRSQQTPQTSTSMHTASLPTSSSSSSTLLLTSELRSAALATDTLLLISQRRRSLPQNHIPSSFGDNAQTNNAVVTLHRTPRILHGDSSPHPTFYMWPGLRCHWRCWANNWVKMLSSVRLNRQKYRSSVKHRRMHWVMVKVSFTNYYDRGDAYRTILGIGYG